MRRIALLVAAVMGVLLPTVTAPADAHEGNYPIVLIPGWHGDATTFDEMIPKLQAQGLTVVDFDSAKAGTQAMGYAPTASGQHISYVAGKVVEEKITAALAANGYASTQKIDIVAHSMGGLVSRFLIEQPGADVDYWSSTDRVVRRRRGRRGDELGEPCRRPHHAGHAEPRHMAGLGPRHARRIRQLERHRRRHGAELAVPHPDGICREVGRVLHHHRRRPLVPAVAHLRLQRRRHPSRVRRRRSGRVALPDRVGPDSRGRPPR